MTVRSLWNAVLTPARFDRKTRCHKGAVYGRGDLVRSAQRQTQTYWAAEDSSRLTDPPVRSRWRGMYLGHFFPHFGHFLIETLPQLYWARTSASARLMFHLWEDVRVEPDPLSRPYISFCLSALKIAPTRVEFIRETQRVFRLTIPPRGDPIGCHPVTEAMGVYREVAAFAQRKTGPIESTGRLYLSRRLFKQDRAENEEEIEAHFARQGFTIVHPEILPFPEQITLVSRAECIAGLGGSAMHLGCFLPPGARQIIVGDRTFAIQKSIADQIGVDCVNAPVGLVPISASSP